MQILLFFLLIILAFSAARQREHSHAARFSLRHTPNVSLHPPLSCKEGKYWWVLLEQCYPLYLYAYSQQPGRPRYCHTVLSNQWHSSSGVQPVRFETWLNRIAGVGRSLKKRKTVAAPIIFRSSNHVTPRVWALSVIPAYVLMDQAQESVQLPTRVWCRGLVVIKESRFVWKVDLLTNNRWGM